MLNTDGGWSSGDDARVLIAAGMTLGKYQLDQIALDMNYMATNFPDAVDPVLDLLDAWDAAQAKMTSLNDSSNGRVLTKADVLEWEAASPGASYGPERELSRIRDMLYLYFGFSQLFSGGQPYSGATPLIRS